MRNFNSRLIVLGVGLLLAGCSTTPRIPQQSNAVKNQALDHRSLAARALQRSQLDEAGLLYRTALGLSSSIDHGPGVVQALIGLGEVSRRRSDMDTAWQLLRQAEAVAVSRDLPGLLVRTRVRQAELELAAGDPQASLARVAAMDQNAGRNTIEAALLAQVRGIAYRRLGDFDRAEDLLKQAVALSGRNTDLLAEASAWYQLASVYSLQQRYEDAIESLLQALEYDLQLENSAGIGAVLEALASVHARQGDRYAQREYLVRACAVYEGSGDRVSARRVQQRLQAELGVQHDLPEDSSIWFLIRLYEEFE